MYARVHSTLLTTVAVAGIGATVAVPVAPREVQLPRAVTAQVRLAAAAPLGAIPLAFLHNQGQYCGIICPFLVQGAITVPLAAAQTPLALLDGLATTGSLTQALGAAAAAVTGPANAAAEGIILNDVDRVVPKAFNTLEVAAVQLINVGSAVLAPGQLPGAVNTARDTILKALNQPLSPPVPTETGAETLPQVVAAEAIKVTAAVAFQAGELVLLGVVQTADAGAQELARTGDPQAAFSAAATQAADVVDVASTIVTKSVDTAVTNIGSALHDPFPKAHLPGDTARVTTVAADEPAPAAPVHDDAPDNPAKSAKDATSVDRPVSKALGGLNRAVRSARDSLGHGPRKVLRHKKSERADVSPKASAKRSESAKSSAKSSGSSKSHGHGHSRSGRHAK